MTRGPEPQALRYHPDTATWTLETRHPEEVADDYTRRYLAWMADEVAHHVPRTVRASIEAGPVLWERHGCG